MAVILNQTATTLLTDGLISYIQYLFKTPEITPDDFRWNADETQTRIFISGPFTVGRQKAGSIPTVTVMRSDFSASNLVNDHLQSARANVFDKEVRMDMMNGGVSIVCECGAGDEAQAMAVFVFLQIQGNRKNLVQGMPFLHRILGMSISKEVPVKESAEIERWQTTINIDVSLYLGWIRKEEPLPQWTESLVYNTSKFYDGTGTITLGSDKISDTGSFFGFMTVNYPQFLQAEFDAGYYYVLLDDGRRLDVAEVVDPHTLRLTKRDDAGKVSAYAADSTRTLPYKVVWNSIHLYTEFKNK